MDDTEPKPPKEWRLDLDPPPPETRHHFRHAGRPAIRVAIHQKYDREPSVELQFDAEFGYQQRYAHMTAEQARQVSDALADMADVLETLERESNDEAA